MDAEFKKIIKKILKKYNTFNNLENEKVSIPEALAMAGDLTIQGKRKNILLLRTTGDKVESIRLDLTDKSLFKSPYFYLAQNDIVYVEPNKAKVNSKPQL